MTVVSFEVFKNISYVMNDLLFLDEELALKGQSVSLVTFN